MAEFAFKVKDSRGREKSGVLKAMSKAQARTQLKRMRYKILTLEDKNAPAKSSSALLGRYVFRDKNGRIQVQIGESKPTTKDLVIFTKQFSTMINSGVPLMQALGILASQQRVRAFGEMLEKIRTSVENGKTLSQSLESYPDTFDNLYVAMVRAGEVSGSLDVILLKLVSYIEKADKIKSQVKSASYYPAVVVVVAVGVIAALLVFVVPTFAKQYQDAGKELPGLTQIVIDLSNTLTDNWYIFLGVIIAAFFGLKSFIRTKKGRILWDRMSLKIPGIGELLRKISVGRFCSTMATMLTSGVSLLEALTICASSSGNKIIESFILTLRGHVEQGSKLSDHLGKDDIFPPMVVSMVSVGESTGALDEMLTKVSAFYEEEVDLAVKALLSMIEPLMMVVIGGSVGFIIIAMYLPVFDMASLVGG
jgi:type IV pilus assembly protein PilC